jgi:hypothetical protein
MIVIYSTSYGNMILGGNEGIMYKNLESRIFNAYLLQSSHKFLRCEENNVDCELWLALYNWTRNAYTVFAEAPELMLKQLHEDTDFRNTYIAEQNGRPKLKDEMRKAITAMNNFLRVVWEATLAGVCYDNALLLPDDYIISKKYVELLRHTGIEMINNRLCANEYCGMFSALWQLTMQTDGFTPPWKYRESIFSPELSVYANGFRRFARCVYDENAIPMIDLFRGLSKNTVAYDRLILFLNNKGFKYGFCLDSSEVKNMESLGISYLKNIKGNETPDGLFIVYDHDHIGFEAWFSALQEPPYGYKLVIQKPRDILSNFDTLPQTVRKFIVDYHAKCDNCGYCSQRNHGKSKPFTIYAEYEGKKYPFCPINHVYSYCWDVLSDELVDGIIAYLDYLYNMNL